VTGAIQPGQRVLAVCTGNICRSPFAEAFLARQAQLRLLVGSAGTHALDGHPATQQAIRVALEWGIDLSGHRARLLTADLALAADHLIALTPVHARVAESLAPAASGVAIHELDVADPYGLGLEDYRACFEQIERNLEALL
jgi:protein-tyrosine-phosphatase